MNAKTCLAALIVLANASANAAPQLVASGELDAWEPITVELKKRQCYTFVLELEEGAELSGFLVNGAYAFSVSRRRFDFRSLSLAPKGPRRFVATLKPCETDASTATMTVVEASNQHRVTKAGTGKFKLFVEAKPASKADTDSGVRILSDKEASEVNRRRIAREACDRCVSQNAGNLPGFRQCLRTYRVNPGDCM